VNAGEIRPEEIERIGPWPVRRYIGAGGFSWVFEVEDEDLGQRRALKMLKPEAAAGEGYKRFWREARILAAVDDPHLVRIYKLDHDPERKLPYYVMELLTGSDLAKLLKTSTEEKRLIPVERAVEIFLDVLQGLERLHELRPIIVHRDIKPGNIQITAEKPGNIQIAARGRAKLLDLGIAHVSRAHDETVDESALTRNVGFIGTVFYASREQLRVEELGPPSDIFSLGICLFETLEGRHPYNDIGDLASKEYQKVLRFYERLEFTRGELDLRFRRTPKPLQAVIRKALAVRSEDRYHDAHEMRIALVRGWDGGRSVGPPGRDWKKWRRRVIFATAGLLLSVGGGGAVWKVFWPLRPMPVVEKPVEPVEGGQTEVEPPPEGPPIVEVPVPRQPSPVQSAAREDAHRLDGEVGQGGSEAGLSPTDLSEFRTRLAGADGLWSEESFEEAALDYSAAVSQLGDVVAMRLAQVKGDALRGREDALAKGSERAAPDPWSDAEQALESAQAAEGARKPTDALRHYANARDQFAVAVETANRALERARRTREGALRAKTALPGEGDCAGLAIPDAKTECRASDEQLSRGDAALDALDPSGAGTHYAKAEQLYLSVQKILDRPRPPVPGPGPITVSPGPASGRDVKAARQTERSEFEELLTEYRDAIEARDLDALMTVWSMDRGSRRLLEAWFSTYDELTVRTEILGETPAPDGKQGVLRFREVISGVSGGKATELFNGLRIANLLKEQGGWRIQSLKRGQA